MKNFLIRAFTAFVYIDTLFATFYYLKPIYFSLLLLFILGLILIFEWPKLIKLNLKNLLLTLIYPIFSFVLLILLNQNLEFRYLLVYLFILTSSFDVGAYISGTLFGKHKIAPKISAKKSWEGFLGGYLLSSLALILLQVFIKINLNNILIIKLLLINIVISILSVAGDFFESYLKRQAKIKDTASYLPGHGGFLDRLDSSLFNIYLFYFGQIFLAQIFKNLFIF